jgi:hypothetical protein
MIDHVISIAVNIIHNIVYTLFHPKLSSYKGKFSECVVIGNGPSLKQTLEKKSFFLNEREIMCVNDFAQSKYFGQVKPAYYLLIDPTYWSKKMSRHLKNTCLKTAQSIKKSVVWPMIIFLPLEAEGSSIFKDLQRSNSNIRVRYFSLVEARSPSFIKNFLLRHNFGAPPAQNVLVAGIFICLNMGFKKIYLVGADHSWHENLYVGNNNTLYFKDVHFYGKRKPKAIPVYKDAEESKRRVFKMSEMFASLSRAFLGYEELERYSKHLGAKVYNASERSYIDAFERYEIKSHN